MKICRDCRYWDNDPCEGPIGECEMKPIFRGNGYEMTEDEFSCDKYDYVMPPVITVHGKFHERWHVVILEWNVSEGIYGSAFVSVKHWADKADAIDEAEDRANGDMKYIPMDKFPWPCHGVALVAS